MAAMLDYGVVAIAMAGIYLGIVAAIFIIQVGSFQWPSVSWLFTLPVFLALDIVYQAVCWTWFGRTVGQVTMGLRVVRRKSFKRPHALQALGRSAFCTLFPVGLLWVVISPTRRSVQDIAARTLVIYA